MEEIWVNGKCVESDKKEKWIVALVQPLRISQRHTPNFCESHLSQEQIERFELDDSSKFWNAVFCKSKETGTKFWGNLIYINY